MKDEKNTKAELIKELKQLQKRITEFEKQKTDSKETDKSITEERNLLRTMIDTLPDLIYVKDT